MVEVSLIVVTDAISTAISPAISYNIRQHLWLRLIGTSDIEQNVIVRSVCAIMKPARRVGVGIFCTIFSHIIVGKVADNIKASPTQAFTQFIHKLLVMLWVEAGEILVSGKRRKQLTGMRNMFLIIGEGIKEDIAILVMGSLHLPIVTQVSLIPLGLLALCTLTAGELQKHLGVTMHTEIA